MSKKILFIIISLLLISPALVPVFSIFTAKETRVCGVDKKNYPSISEAKKLGVEISYDFPCEYPESEEALFERYKNIEMTGMLLDFLVNKSYIQLFIRDNFDQQEYLGFFNDKRFDDYFPGDQLRINGRINKNTQVIAIDKITNISAGDFISFECLLKEIDEDRLQCEENGNVHSFLYNNDTKIVAGFINPATINDLRVNDKLKIRIDSQGNIKTLIVKKRGDLEFLKSHVFILNGVIKEINNQENYLLIESEDLVKKVIINDKTRLVKKYFGKFNLNNFKTGDDLYIIGRTNDGKNFEAITIKNNSVWK